MDLLLAHSFFLLNDPKQIAKSRPYPPLGTLYAASFLRQKGYAAGLFDAMLATGTGEFEALLASERPHIVVVYEDQFNFLNKMCLLHSRKEACRMARIARVHGCIVIAAGSDVSDHPEIYFSNGVQYGIIGEPEHSLAELVDAISGRNGRQIASIPGIAIPDERHPNAVRRTAPRSPERDLDVFPFPAWDMINADRYRNVWVEAHGYFSVNMVSTRGCPFHCNWCAKPIWGQRYAMRSPANVAEEMALIKRTLRPDHIWFADDIFGLQPKWVVEFAHEVNARDASVPFMIQTRADLMTGKAVAALAGAGCAEVWLGAESGSQKILDAMDKGITTEQIRTARDRLRHSSIRACFFVQFGYPGETFDDIMATVELIREARPDDIGVSVSNPLPGTAFHDMVKAQLGDKDHWENSNDLAMMFQGTYTTPFYRKLHTLLHRELLLLQRDGNNGEKDEIQSEWAEIAASEFQYRSSSPTRILKQRSALVAPDLSRRWN